ncbi:MAG: GNAT family protein [Methylocystis sp.]|uniref:GNAT family N-acetyltransferase n=1 Tax=Methylocystis sp. TaxID=1911079 RepID=UPI0039547026
MAIFSVIGRRDLPIKGEGLYLRASEMRDYVEWAELREKSRSFLTPWEPLWPIDDLTRASFRYRVRRHAEEMARDEAYSFFIFRDEDDALMGGLSFGHVRRGVSQAATLGYWMGEPYAGKGHMTRAVRAACAYAFEKRGFHRIEAACLPTNEPSKRLLERVGFKQEGYARSYLNINGQWRDHLLYALLETDPQPINPPSAAA